MRTSADCSPAALSVDTSRIPERDRVEYWRLSVCDGFVPLEVSPGDTNLVGQISGTDVADTRVRRIAGSEHRFSRRAVDIRRGDPEVLHLMCLERGTTTMQQDGRTATLQPGDLLFYDSSRSFEFRTTGAFEYTVLLMPKSLLGLTDRAYRECTARRIRPTEGLAAVVRDHARSVARYGQSGRTAQALGLQQSLMSLAAALMPGADVRTTIAAQAFEVATGHIARHLADPDLGPGSVAAACGISTSYLHRLFAGTGTGVAEYIREQRLLAAHRHLLAPASGTESIAAIGRRSGLGDPSHFSRLFKARFGVTPRELRRASGPSIAV